VACAVVHTQRIDTCAAATAALTVSAPVAGRADLPQRPGGALEEYSTPRWWAPKIVASSLRHLCALTCASRTRGGHPRRDPVGRLARRARMRVADLLDEWELTADTPRRPTGTCPWWVRDAHRAGRPDRAQVASRTGRRHDTWPCGLGGRRRGRIVARRPAPRSAAAGTPGPSRSHLCLGSGGVRDRRQLYAHLHIPAPPQPAPLPGPGRRGHQRLRAGDSPLPRAWSSRASCWATSGRRPAAAGRTTRPAVRQRGSPPPAAHGWPSTPKRCPATRTTNCALAVEPVGRTPPGRSARRCAALRHPGSTWAGLDEERAAGLGGGRMVHWPSSRTPRRLVTSASR